MAEPTTPLTPADSGRLQTEMEFISELCAVLAGSLEMQPILDWMTSKTTAMLGADECSIRLLSADQATTKTVVIMDRGGLEAGTSSWPLPLKSSVMGFATWSPPCGRFSRCPSWWTGTSPG
jgi:hypothetical protein